MSTEAEKPRIIFVDDEPNVLQALRRSLRSMRSSWDMEFISDGGEAVKKVQTEPVDAIVTDMQMPVIDGAVVLGEAAKHHPESIRFVLSGYADKSALLRVLGPAHRIFSKPCQTESLIDALNSSFELRKMLPVDRLRILVSGLSSVPVPSAQYFELVQILEDPLASMQDISNMIESDIGLSAQLLRLANSAFFSLSKPVNNCRQAVDMLGLDTVRALIVVSEFYLSENLDPSLIQENCLLAKRSLRIGGSAHKIAKKLNMTDAEIGEAATAGLLSHIGTAILKIDKPFEFNAAVSQVESGENTISSSEQSHFGVTHAQLGAFLVGLWGFSDNVIEAIAFHHQPSLLNNTHLTPLAAVHLAQAAVGFDYGYEENLFPTGLRMDFLDNTYLERVGLGEFLSQYLEPA